MKSYLNNAICIPLILIISVYLLALNSTLYENCYENNMALIEISLRNKSNDKFVYYDSLCYPKIGFGLI